MAGGIETLEILKEPGSYETLEDHSAILATGMEKAATDAGVPLAINRVGSMLTPFFIKNAGDAVTNFTQATSGDVAAYSVFFNAMLDNGVYLAPSQYEAMFVGLMHTEETIKQTIEASSRAFVAVAQSRRG
jgi:glutamate-1-semialdehyde 2,1-aminomutase